jgi:ABC-2 type transport system permease protein
MQYKASFVMLSIGGFVVYSTEFFGVWALFDRFKTIRGWSLPQAALLYGMVSVAFALSEAGARGFDTFGRMVKSGDFDRLLLRPRSTALQLLGQDLQLMRVGRFAQGMVVLVWAMSRLGAEWTTDKAILLAGSILGGACLFSGLFVLQATLAFWTVESLEIANTVTYGGVETAQFPISIYRPWLRGFFTFVVPLAFIDYFPALAILGKPGGYPILSWLAPAAGVGFLAIALQVWKLGVRHYCSTGS